MFDDTFTIICYIKTTADYKLFGGPSHGLTLHLQLPTNASRAWQHKKGTSLAYLQQ